MKLLLDGRRSLFDVLCVLFFVFFVLLCLARCLAFDNSCALVVDVRCCLLRFVVVLGLLVVCCVSVVVCCSLFVVGCLLLVVCCLLRFVVCCLLFVVCRSLFAVRCTLFVAS